LRNFALEDDREKVLAKYCQSLARAFLEIIFLYLKQVLETETFLIYDFWNPIREGIFNEGVKADNFVIESWTEEPMKKIAKEEGKPITSSLLSRSQRQNS
jgi:hypothetical protein